MVPRPEASCGSQSKDRHVAHEGRGGWRSVPQAEQVRLGQFRPQGPVDPVLGRLDLLDPVGVDQAGEDAVGRLADRGLLVVEGEVHQFVLVSSAGWNTGSDRSSSKSSKSASTAMPMWAVSGVMPDTLAIRRVPSSSSTRATTSG